MRIQIILSLLTNVALIVALGLTVNNLKLVRAKAEVDEAEAVKTIKLAAAVGFDSGCMTAIVQAKHLESGDPDAQLYGDWCTKNAMAFGKSVDFK